MFLNGEPRVVAKWKRCSGSMFLLDTNIVSELRRPRPHGGVVSWLSKTDDTHLFLSAVTLGEIQAGIEITRDQDAAKAAALQGWLDLLADTHQVLSMDGTTFRLWAGLMHRRSNTLYEDAMIAATAQQHNLVVVTRNTSDFKHFPVRTLNPFV